MFRKIGSLLMTILGLALLVYSAARSLDFISLTLPPDRQILAYFGLAALDGGIIAWLLAFLYGSRGWQRAISLLMVIIDLVGAVAMFTADTMLNAGKAGLGAGLSAETTNTAILGLSGIIALNIAATIAHHLTDPDKLREMAEEEAQDKIEDEELKLIKDNAATLAAEVSPLRALAWQERQRARYLGLAGVQPAIIDGKSYDVSKIPTKANEESTAPAWWPLGKTKDAKPAEHPALVSDTCAECGAPAGPGKGVSWLYDELPVSESNPERLCYACAKAYMQPQEGEASEESKGVDPAVIAAVLAGIAKNQAAGAGNGNGHRVYQSETEGLDPKNLTGAE